MSTRLRFRQRFSPWLRAELRAKLRRGGEHWATRGDLKACYRLLLGRDADANGVRTYRRMIGEGIAVEELTTYFLSSAEFRERHSWLLQPNAVAPSAYAVDGLTVYTWANDQTVGQSLSAHGEYEPDVTSAVRSELSEGMTFVDVGASFGYFSILARQLVGSAGRVVAIEPGASNCSLLLLNAAAGGMT